MIESLRLGDRLHHRPDELSGGQQQRVAVARALVSRPDIIFADEPTGNLDSKSGQEVLGFLRRAVDDWDQTVVMVTHDPGAASFADVVIFLRDGKLVGRARVAHGRSSDRPDQGARGVTCAPCSSSAPELDQPTSSDSHSPRSPSCSASASSSRPSCVKDGLMRTFDTIVEDANADGRRGGPRHATSSPRSSSATVRSTRASTTSCWASTGCRRRSRSPPASRSCRSRTDGSTIEYVCADLRVQLERVGARLARPRRRQDPRRPGPVRPRRGHRRPRGLRRRRDLRPGRHRRVASRSSSSDSHASARRTPWPARCSCR